MISLFLKKLILLPVSLFTKIQFWICGVKCGKRVSVVYKPIMLKSKRNRIFIGDNVNINSGIRANPIGKGSRTIFSVRGDGKIVIGNRVGMSNCSIVCDSSVVIEDEACIGGGTCIWDTDFHSIDADERLNGNINVPTKPVVIGQRAFIGGGVTILKGVCIGKESVIGAESVVTKSVPDGEIWAGNPARFIKKIDTK